MAGYLLLEGGAEFGGRMAEPDRRAIALAGGDDAPIRIIPAAAAPDNNHERAGQNGVRWFQHLGATNVVSLPLIDQSSAGDPALAAELRAARLIYLLGGFPHHLGQTLAGSLCWQAVLEAYQAGAVIAGSSAGAMVLCDWYYDPQRGQVVRGLGLLSNSCVLPHHHTFGRSWAADLAARLPAAVLIGIDEQTGMIDDVAGETGRRWQAYGQGMVTLYRAGRPEAYRADTPFSIVLNAAGSPSAS